MQIPVVMAFRKRLKKRGYIDVSIYKEKGEENLYKITAVEPLAKTVIVKLATIEYMFNSFKF